jgi:uncharacterized protein (UPF0335 family)
MTDTDQSYAVIADKFLRLVERYKWREAEKKDVAEQQKELISEATGRCYSTKGMIKVIAMRKKKPDDLSK